MSINRHQAHRTSSTGNDPADGGPGDRVGRGGSAGAHRQRELAIRRLRRLAYLIESDAPDFMLLVERRLVDEALAGIKRGLQITRAQRNPESAAGQPHRAEAVAGSV